MVMQSATSSLVAGSLSSGIVMATTTIKVLRSFLLDGKPTKVGSVVEVDGSLAAELVFMRKAVPAAKPVPRAAAVKVADQPKEPAK